MLAISFLISIERRLSNCMILEGGLHCFRIVMKTEALTSSTEINPNQRTWIDNSFDLNNLSVNAVPKSNSTI